MTTHTTPQTPEVLPGHRPRRDRMFKMRLTKPEAKKLKSWAHENELSQADFVRFMIFARTTFAPPNASKLETIARQLSGIATNINQCQHTINEAQKSGTLSPAQFEAMHKSIAEGRKLWTDPLTELRAELRKLRPATNVDNHSGDELGAARMIIKTGGISAGDGSRITAYTVTQADNERVQVIQDENDQLLIADQFAELRGRKNGLLHIVIAPGQELTADELKATVSAIRSEFRFNPNDPETLTLHQSNRADGTLQKHYHLVRPTADSETGRTYKLFRSKAKDEAVSRLCELQFGHQLTSGANNDFSEMRLRELGHDEMADFLAAELSGEDKPRAAYSRENHQQAKRKDFNLPGLRQQLTEIVSLPRLDQPEALAELIHNQGLELAEAVSEGRGRSRINIELPGGLKAHNGNRTLKIKTAEVAQFIHETKEIMRALRSERTERPDLAESAIADHRRSGEDSPIKSGNDPAPERLIEDTSGSSQELTDANVLVAAAETLQPQAQSFANNRAGDLSAVDLEPIPDVNDPNLMQKLAMMLKRQVEKTAALVRSMQQGGAMFSSKM